MDNKNNIIIAAIILLLIVVGAFFFLSNDKTSSTQEAATDEVILSTPEGTDGEMIKTFSLDDVSEHFVDTDCWLVIDGMVYDVTDFIIENQHPGEEAIIEGCGIDATELFETRPMGSGTEHSDTARELLEDYYIGDLGEEEEVMGESDEGGVVMLKIEDVKVGTGEEAVKGSTVTVNYLGTLEDGEKFDSSYDREEPFSFNLGGKQVIEGWEEGIQGMKVGGKRILTIPPDLAYGDRAVGTIPPNSVLIFEVELLKVE